MEIRQLKYFLEVAKEENISKAAAKLYISQPSLSRVMKELEEELNTTLFTKTNRYTKLTDNGKLFEQRAIEILSLINKTEDEFKKTNNDIYATLHIGAGETDFFSYIAKTVKNVSLNYPNIKFQFYSGVSTDILNKIQEGTLEFGFLVEPINVENLQSLYINKSENYGVLVRNDSIWASKEFISKEDLLKMPIISTRLNNLAKDWLGDIYSKLNIVISGPMPLNAIKLVEEGLGNFLSIEMAEYQNLDNLTFIPLKDEVARRWSLVWKDYSLLPKAHKIFIEEFKKAVD